MLSLQHKGPAYTSVWEVPSRVWLRSRCIVDSGYFTGSLCSSTTMGSQCNIWTIQNCFKGAGHSYTSRTTYAWVGLGAARVW